MATMENALDPNQQQVAAQTAVPDRPAVEMLLMLLRVGRRIDALRAAELKPAGLSNGRLGVLMALSAEPGVTPGHLAERQGISRATVTGLVDGLEKCGYVQRQALAGDRRAQSLFLTAKGEEAVAHGVPVVVDLLTNVIAECSEVEVDSAVQMLRKMWEALNQFESRKDAE